MISQQPQVAWWLKCFEVTNMGMGSNLKTLKKGRD